MLFIITGSGRKLLAQQMSVECRVTNYDESKGLSNRKITRLLEDHQGYLWIQNGMFPKLPNLVKLPALTGTPLF
jgi:hypothetical protein